VADNYRAQRRWNARYQRLEICVATTVVRYDDSAHTVTDDTDRLEEALRLTCNRVGDVFSPDHRALVPCSSDEVGVYWETLRRIEHRTGDIFSPDHRIIVERGSLDIKLVGAYRLPPSGW